MTPIFCHEYTITAMHRESKMGVQQIVITIVTEQRENNSFEAVEQALKYFDKDINISHKLLLEGYRND
jgi:hypothetical protein